MKNIARVYALFVLSACTPEPAGAPAQSQPGAPCPQRNLTQACQCGGQAGRQVCADNGWLTCECSLDGTGGNVTIPSFEGNNRSDITFEWERTPASETDRSCLPGDYEGNFFGEYWSVLTAFGGMPFSVPVANTDLPGAPSGFHFTMEPAQGGETIQRVRGEMDGVADLAFPFKAQIEGSLDCKTGVFTARLYDGSYSVLADGLLPQKFEGVMSAVYDKRTHTFVDGDWDVAESTAMPPGMLAPTLPRTYARDGYGGFGNWASGLVRDPNDPTLTPCPTNYTCGQGPLGPNKLLCNGLLGTPTCVTDADCDTLFPGEGVLCLKASAFSLCLRECKP